MSRRYYDIVNSLITGIRNIVPESDSSYVFICAEDTKGSVSAPDDWIMDPMRRTREFDIRSTEFTVPGPGCDLKSKVAIRIVYELNQDLGFLDSMIQEDIQSIINNVMFDTQYWGIYADTVFVPSDENPTSELISNANGTPSTIVVSIPVVIFYRKEN